MWAGSPWATRPGHGRRRRVQDHAARQGRQHAAMPISAATRCSPAARSSRRCRASWRARWTRSTMRSCRSRASTAARHSTSSPRPPRSAARSGPSSAATRALIEQRLAEIAGSIGTALGVTATVEFERGYPPTVNDAEMSVLGADGAADIVGEAAVDRAPEPVMGAEDFAFMLQKVPGAYIWMGNRRRRGRPLLPHPDLRLQRRGPAHRRQLLGAAGRAAAATPTAFHSSRSIAPASRRARPGTAR